MVSINHIKIAAAIIITGFITGCAAVSFDQPKTYSTVMAGTADTRLGQYAAYETAKHAGQSAFYPLNQGMDALGVRLRLAERAQKSIDLQYFLMKNDTAGAVMANALLKAADRGVRVRFLLDDIFTTVPDDSFLLINKHPNIEIRIFNPVSRSGIYAFNFIGQFKRANRRMHNKSFTVDNAITVVGGRNIADEYFQLKEDSVFIDFDILAIGPIADAVSASFDQFWNHSRAVPIDQFIKDRKKEDLETVREEIAEEFDHIYDTVYKQALESQLLQDLINGRQPLFIGPAEVFADEPDKLVEEIDETHMRLAQQLREILLQADKEIMFITPYYVPGDRGVTSLRDHVERGVRVIILTNSLASTNHVAVHSGYSRYRRDIVEAGAELYEARASAASELYDGEEALDTLTLHTKAILIDRRYVFVGSLNLDPRSVAINAEMGLFIDCEPMVSGFTRDLEDALSAFAYRVRLNDKGKLEWRGRIDGREVVETRDPQTGWWRRFKAWFMKIAPEDQL
jgi:putative cardiolipin synthase